MLLFTFCPCTFLKMSWTWWFWSCWRGGSWWCPPWPPSPRLCLIPSSSSWTLWCPWGLFPLLIMSSRGLVMALVCAAGGDGGEISILLLRRSNPYNRGPSSPSISLSMLNPRSSSYMLLLLLSWAWCSSSTPPLLKNWLRDFLSFSSLTELACREFWRYSSAIFVTVLTGIKLKWHKQQDQPRSTFTIRAVFWFRRCSLFNWRFPVFLCFSRKCRRELYSGANPVLAHSSLSAPALSAARATRWTWWTQRQCSGRTAALAWRGRWRGACRWAPQPR